jgi:glycosyltransferase involved in cell wall biosynthesis
VSSPGAGQPLTVVVAHNRYVAAQPSGENTVVDAEIAELTRAGVRVVPFLRSSDEIATLPAARRAALIVSPAYAHRAQRDLRALLERERPDVLHLHNPYPLLSPWVVRTAQACGVPVVHTLHNFRQTCVNGLHQRQGADCHDCTGRRLGTPAIRHACYRGSRAQSVVMAATLALHRGTWPRLDRVLALTPAMADYARTLGIPADRIVVRPNAVADPGRHDQAGDGFLFAGRLSAEKGIGLLLDAWQRHPVGVLGPLRIAGDGPLAALVRERALARADIEYLGRLDPPGVVAATRRSAAVVVPSTWDEVCPMIVIEALASARPVLASDRGGLPWLVGDAGWTIEPSVDALAAALPAARAGAAGLVLRARAAYEARFTPEVATRTLLDVYRGMLH